MERELERAYQHCFAIARQHAENFPTASRLLPRAMRPAVAAIYAFARTADDIADEGELPAPIRRKRLDAWEQLLDRIEQGMRVDHPIFVALADAIARFSLPISPLRKLLVAFRMDTEVHAYATESELLFYCRHSAAPIGRLLLALFAVRSAAAERASDALCIGLQLVNFWQDIALDLSRGRCYLPASWLQAASLTPEDLLAHRFQPEALGPVWQQAFAFTEARFAEAEGLAAMLPRRLAMQAAASREGGLRILRQLRKRSTLDQRPRLRWPDRLAMLWQALRWGLR